MLAKSESLAGAFWCFSVDPPEAKNDCMPINPGTGLLAFGFCGTSLDDGDDVCVTIGVKVVVDGAGGVPFDFSFAFVNVIALGMITERLLTRTDGWDVAGLDVASSPLRIAFVKLLPTILLGEEFDGLLSGDVSALTENGELTSNFGFGDGSLRPSSLALPLS